MSTEGVASAQRDRQGWAVSIFETGRGRQLLQMGRLADAAAALEGQLPVDMAPHIVSVLDAAGVVALGRVAIHMGDPGLSRQAREIAQVMLGQERPERPSSRRLAARVAGNGRWRRCQRSRVAPSVGGGGAPVHRPPLSDGRGRRGPPGPHRARGARRRARRPRCGRGPVPGPAQPPGPIDSGGRRSCPRSTGPQPQRPRGSGGAL